MSRIDVPDSSVVGPGRNTIGGIPFAGDRGVFGVEWSSGDGSTWKKAIIKPSISLLSWVLCADKWDGAELNRTSLSVRMIDATGAVQPADEAEHLPDGASGHHVVWIA